MIKAPINLRASELELIQSVLAAHPEVTGAILFGSRAMGTAKPSSDIDIALEGVTRTVRVAAIAAELEELPLPYRFDVIALERITHEPLREHIARVGVRLYPCDPTISEFTTTD